MQHILGLHPRETVDWPRSDSLAQRDRRHTDICNKVKLQRANFHFKVLSSAYSRQMTFCTYSRATSAFHIFGLFVAPGNQCPTALHVQGCWNGFLLLSPLHCYQHNQWKKSLPPDCSLDRENVNITYPNLFQTPWHYFYIISIWFSNLH